MFVRIPWGYRPTVVRCFDLIVERPDCIWDCLTDVDILVRSGKLTKVYFSILLLNVLISLS